MADWTGITKLGQAIVNKVKLGSAVDGPLVVAVFISFLCIVAYTIRPTRLLLYIAVLGICIYGVGYVYFMITDPDKLRTEEHEQIKWQISHGLGQSGSKELSEEKLDEMKSVTNPALKQLDKGKEDNK